MLWLASYPRSGNTFFRIVLREVYGLESSTFHNETSYPVDANYQEYPVVKTHLLPCELEPADESIPAVYLVRDGRDCVISLAHYRKDLIDGSTDFEENLYHAINAAGGSHFGGWSRHVREWLDRAALVIYFEELIADPIKCMERLRPFLDLPQPRTDRVPTFSELKKNDFAYGSGKEHGYSQEQRDHIRTNKFRRGKAGGWRDEMPHAHHLRFLRLHGRELTRLGYEAIEKGDWSSGCLVSGEEQRDFPPVQQSPVTSPPVHQSTSHQTPFSPTRQPIIHRNRRQRVLIDASKLVPHAFDGIKRYVHELLKALVPIAENEPERWKFTVGLSDFRVFDLLEIRDHIHRAAVPAEGECLTQQAEGQPQVPQANVPPVESAEPRHSRIKALNGRMKQGLKRVLGPRMIQCAKDSITWFRSLSTAHPGEYDLLHLTLPGLWRAYARMKIPCVTTVHDLSYEVCPQFHTAENVFAHRRGMKFALSRGATILADSESTRRQVIQHYAVPEDRVLTAQLACDERFINLAQSSQVREVLKKHNIPDGPYVLSVGTLEPRKNVASTIKAFLRLIQRRPDLKANLVVAGRSGWGKLAEMEDAARCPRICFVDFVEDFDLRALYSGAALLSYVSFYEGFGLPPLEAMSCGAPVVYGDVAAVPEVVGRAGIPVDPHSIEQIEQAFERLLTDEALRRELSYQAVLRSLDFSWSRLAERTLEAYERALHLARQGGSPRGTMSTARQGAQSVLKGQGILQGPWQDQGQSSTVEGGGRWAA